MKNGMVLLPERLILTRTTLGPDNIPDANPEVIIIGSPIDKTKNPKVTLGMTLSDITGVVVYQSVFFFANGEWLNSR